MLSPLVRIAHLRVFFIKAVKVLPVLLRQAEDDLVFLVETVLRLVRHTLPIRLTIKKNSIDGDKEDLTYHKAYA